MSTESIAAFAASLAEEQRNPADFVAAWREGVYLLGEGYFMLRKPLAECTSKEDMQPKVDMIRSRLNVMSSGERVLALVMLQFYNDDYCKVDRPSFSDVAYYLDARSLKVVCRLLCSYQGW